MTEKPSAEPLTAEDPTRVEKMLRGHAAMGSEALCIMSSESAAILRLLDAARLSQESSARAAGWREGVEAAAKRCEERADAAHAVNDAGRGNGLRAAAAEIRALLPTPPTAEQGDTIICTDDRTGEVVGHMVDVTDAIRAFLPTPRPATPAQPMTGRMVREPGGFAGVADWQAGPPELTEPQRVEAMLRHHANLQTELIPLWSREAKVAVDLLDAERAAHRETIREMQGADANWMVAANARDAAEARVQRLEEALRTAMQRCNESGIGEAGLVATIHAVHGILRAALAADQKKGS